MDTRFESEVERVLCPRDVRVIWIRLSVLTFVGIVIVILCECHADEPSEHSLAVDRSDVAVAVLGEFQQEPGAPPPLGDFVSNQDGMARRSQGTWARYYNHSVTSRNSLGQVYAFIPPGKFHFGRRESLESLAQEFPGLIESMCDREGYREVTISTPFLICTTETTIEEFRAYVRDRSRDPQWPGIECQTNKYGGTGISSDAESDEGRQYTPWHTGWELSSAHPATNVSWNDAVQFCQWLTERERRQGRLSPKARYAIPTEQQWEYACRAGSTTHFYFGSKGDTFFEFENILDESAKPLFQHSKNLNRGYDGFCFTAPVGSFVPNGFGIHDMHGNVMEWCDGELEHRENTLPRNRDQTLRPVRGGWYGTLPHYARAASRAAMGERNCKSTLGFRCVIVQTEAEGQLREQKK